MQSKHSLPLRGEKGESLTEVFIAATVGILVVTALTFATIFSLRNASFAKNSAQATKLAQEGIEKVRAGRDRNSNINISGISTVDSWSGSKPIWGYQIKQSGGCDNPLPAGTGGKCYFNINTDGSLTNNVDGYAFVPTFALPIPSSAEQILYGNLKFKRAVILSDDSSYSSQKTITVIVQWKDFAGDHDSKLTTILRKL